MLCVVNLLFVRAFRNLGFRSLQVGKINTFFRKSKFLSTLPEKFRPVFSVTPLTNSMPEHLRIGFCPLSAAKAKRQGSRTAPPERSRHDRDMRRSSGIFVPGRRLHGLDVDRDERSLAEAGPQTALDIDGQFVRTGDAHRPVDPHMHLDGD